MKSALSGWHAQQEPNQGYPVPSQAPSLSPFSFPAPATTVNQAHFPSLTASVQAPVTFMPEASAGPAQPPAAAVPPTLVLSDSIDDMLGLFNTEESALSMQRRSSSTLSQGLSAMLDFLHTHGDEVISSTKSFSHHPAASCDTHADAQYSSASLTHRMLCLPIFLLTAWHVLYQSHMCPGSVSHSTAPVCLLLLCLYRVAW